MSDYTEYTVRVSHDDLEEMVRGELIEAIKCHKKEIAEFEKDYDGYVHNEDYQFSRKFINAAAIVLRWYSLPDKWAALDKLEKEYEVRD